MYGLPHTAEIEHLRRVVRRFILADVAFFALVCAWVSVHLSPVYLAVVLPVSAPFLIFDAGAWDLGKDELGMRRNLGVLGLLLALVGVGQNLGASEENLAWGAPALALAGLSIVAVFLCHWARGIVARNWHDSHGGGGGELLDAAKRLPGSVDPTLPVRAGLPSGWVGRRKL